MHEYCLKCIPDIIKKMRFLNDTKHKCVMPGNELISPRPNLLFNILFVLSQDDNLNNSVSVIWFIY